MKFHGKTLILTAIAFASAGLIACGASVAADGQKAETQEIKPMPMKTAAAAKKGSCEHGGKMGMKGGCEHGGKGGMKGGCEHGGKGGMMKGGCEHGGQMGMKPMAKPIKIQVDDVTIIILVNKDGSAKVAKMGGCEHGKKAAPAAAPKAEPAKK